MISEEEELDRLVDRLRGAEIGIRGISRQRRTLEDAFIDIVQEAE